MSERNAEVDWRRSHDNRNAEDQSYQDCAGKCRLKKLHEAFQVSCTLSKSQPGAIIFPPDGGIESEARRR
jgi:hypothetical protein